jgi:hypothetical protein
MRSLCLQIKKINLSHQIASDFQGIQEQSKFLRMTKHRFGALCAFLCVRQQIAGKQYKVVRLRVERPVAI